MSAKSTPSIQVSEDRELSDEALEVVTGGSNTLASSLSTATNGWVATTVTQQTASIAQLEKKTQM